MHSPYEWYRWIATVAALAAVVPIAWLYVTRESQTPARHAAMLAAGVAALAGTFGRRGATRIGWRFVGLAVVLMAAAQLTRGYEPSDPLPWRAELLMASADLALVIALLAIARAHQAVRDRGIVIDALIVTAALTALWWPVYMEPALAGSDGTRTELLVVAHPILDLLLAASALALLPVAFRRRAGLVPLYVGVATTIAGHVVYHTGHHMRALLPTGGEELAWVAAALFLGFGALHAPDTDPVAVDVKLLRRRRIHALFAVTTVSPSVLLALAVVEDHVDRVVVVAAACAIATFLLVSMRFATLVGVEREAAAQRGAQRFAALVRSSQDAIFVVDRRGAISFASPAAAAFTGRAAVELTGTSLPLWFPAEEAVRVAEHLERATTLEPGVGLDLEGRYIDGVAEPGEFEMTVVNLLTTRDVEGLVVTVRDVTSRKRLERELAQKALRDELTGLANRALFMDRLEHALQRLHRAPGSVAVLFLDLDDFKAVNDGLGHSSGDALLVAVAERLERCVRPSDTIARLGGDEFAVLLEEATDDEAQTTARRLLETLQLPVEIDTLSVNVPVSIGVAVARELASPGSLMRDADIALYRAKADGKGRIATFDASMRWAAYERLRVRTELSRAVEDDRLHLMFQPIVALGTDEIHGAEALLRWEHPTLGHIPPSEFIPIGEESGLIVPIGDWVLRHACEAAVRWNTVAERDVYVSVNVSARQLRERSFADRVRQVLSETGLRPALLMIELTESVLIDEVATEHLVERVVPIGVAVAIDDFGTGYSSLAYLQRLPVDVVKIDRSFVSRIDHDGTRAVIESIAAIARVMGFSSIAEGIETDEQLGHLEAFDCRYGQGYRYSEPVDVETLTALLRAGTTWRGPPRAAAAAG